MSQIKERPIPFNAPMVRAILEGRKTVTRRPIKPSMRGFNVSFELHQQEDGSWRPMHTFDESCMDDQGTEHPIACPYGQPGDRLWVREAFRTSFRYDAIKPSNQPVSPTGKTLAVPFWYDADLNGDLSPLHSGLGPGKYRPGMFMPRAASRILLEITDVRVERLQDISEDQAMAEGITHADEGLFHVEDSRHLGADPRESYAGLWESTGGNWDANPWVWVVEFKRVTP